MLPPPGLGRGLVIGVPISVLMWVSIIHAIAHLI
jgi:hypothetical protein